jgi:adhesin transport system membrane fusion protein
MAREDLEFANDAHALVERTVTPAASWMIFAVIAGLATLGFWAWQAHVEQSTRSPGKIIPSSQVQVVESLEPGIVAEILVKEGDVVEAGQSLILMDDTGSAARLGELRQKERALDAELLRLEAQASGAEAFSPPQAQDLASEQFIADQKAVFEITRLKRIGQMRVRREQVEQKRQALAEADVTTEKRNDQLQYMRKELELTRNLFKKDAVPEIELLKIERAAAELEGDIKIYEAARPRLLAEIAEAEALMQADETTFRAETQSRIAEVKAELSVTRESLRAAEDRVNRTTMRAPVKGIVNRISVATVGEVIQAGTEIIEIVPLDDSLLVEAKVRPEDIAFVRPGLKAVIRLTAYDYRKYGYLTGSVDRIAADTFTDENKETYYQVIISDIKINQTDQTESIKLIPGMVATVDIIAGDRTVLEYILGPVLTMSDFAFREPR